MTYLQAVEELSALLESATLEYEYNVLAEAGSELVPTGNNAMTPVESSSDDKPSFGDRAKSAAVGTAKKIKAILHRMWELIKSLAKRLWDFIKKIATKDNSHAPMTVAGEQGTKVSVVRAVAEPRAYANAVLKLKAQMMNTSKVLTEEEIVEVLKYINDSATFEAGKPIPAKLKDYQDASNVVSKVVDQLDHMPIHDAIGAEGVTMIGKAATAISKTFSTFVSGVSKLVPMNRKNGEERANATNMKDEMNKKNEHAAYMNKRDGFGNVVFQEPHGESVEAGSLEFMATKARLLEEAAELYGMMAKVTGTTETLAEDAHSEPVAEKQKDIEDIPEETPVVAKEYPEDTSGGEGKADDHLEDIKDVVDGDVKAMELLTKDEQSKTITESIDLVFDL